MRIVIPDYIDKLGDKIIPYMVMNSENSMLILSEDAPEEIKTAKQEYDKWWSQNAYGQG